MLNYRHERLRAPVLFLSIIFHTFAIFAFCEASSILQQQQHVSGVKHLHAQAASSVQQQLKQLTPTTSPSLMTTLVAQQQPDQALNQIEENLRQQSGHQGTKHHEQQHYNGAQEIASRRRSEIPEDDQAPLATINNHSNRNYHPSQVAQLRPPQYVDVSALVGRNTSISSSSNSYATSNGNSVLSPKSRSGLPECATQQVCNAIFVRMNYTQRLCECSSNYNWKCSNNIDPQDGHTIELTRKFDKRIYTQIKTCEPLREVRACKSPTDWTLLALQSERSGKAHYVVVCKCPTWAQLEGPYTHNHPPYANIPGIRVYGMLCAHQTARSSSAQTYSSYNPALGIYPEFPWSEALNVLNTTNLAATLNSH